MANCSNLCVRYHKNSSLDALNDDPLEVNPDIVGKGVNKFLLQSIRTHHLIRISGNSSLLRQRPRHLWSHRLWLFVGLASRFLLQRG